MKIRAFGVEIDELPRTALAFSMALVMTLVLCCGFSCLNKSGWLALAEQDIPVFTLQAQNILKLVDATGADAKLAGMISGVAVAVTKAVKDAVDAYNLDPTETTLQKVRAALDEAGANLPSSLQAIAGNFASPTDLLIITAAVDTIVVGLDIIASQIPGPTSTARALRMSKQKKMAGLKPTKLPTAKDLRHAWNANVCSIAPGQCPTM